MLVEPKTTWTGDPSPKRVDCSATISADATSRTDWTTATDQELATACVVCDQAAFAELVRRYQRPLYLMACRLLGNHEDARDATQQALLQAYLALPKSRADLPVRPWLFRILRNQCVDRLRKRDAIPFSQLRRNRSDDEGDLAIDALDTGPLPDEVAERADLRRIVEDAVAALPTRYRPVVAMRYDDDLTFAEIGARLRVPEPTARTLFQRAKAMLRRTLAAHCAEMRLPSATSLSP